MKWRTYIVSGQQLIKKVGYRSKSESVCENVGQVIDTHKAKIAAWKSDVIGRSAPIYTKQWRGKCLCQSFIGKSMDAGKPAVMASQVTWIQVQVLNLITCGNLYLFGWCHGLPQVAVCVAQLAVSSHHHHHPLWCPNRVVAALHQLLVSLLPSTVSWC